MKQDGRRLKNSPQMKKALSYAHDTRNSFGENDKASRKAIPARKAGENRSSRRKAVQAINSSGQLDEEKVAVLESSLRNDVERVGGWRKKADIPLADFIKRQECRRAHREPCPPASTQHETN